LLFVLHICALPLPMTGPPGFLPKILIGIVAGLGYDIMFLLFKKWSWLAAVVMGALGPPMMLFLILFTMQLFSVPGAAQLGQALASPIALIVMLAVGTLGGLIGLFVYNRLKNTSVVSRIQAG
jgi:ABC-type thiamin/hydroxymethylpyrimidine transport system permease subunit